MNILKIPGIVLAVHLVAFLCVFAIPGCRSTTRQSSSSAPAELPSDTPPTVNYPSNAPASPVASAPERPASTSDAALNPPLVSAPTSDYGASPTVHFNPTRPGTPVAAALQTPAAADVTPATTYTAVSGDSLWKIAKKHGLTAAELTAANNLKPGAPIRAGQKLIIPGKGPGPANAAAPSSPAAPAGASDTLTYKVKPGETLATIAKRSGTSVATIRSLNKLKTDTVRAGQEIILPAGGSSAAALASSPDAAAVDAAKSGQNGTKHVVRAGETMSTIAKQYHVPLRDIAAANNISDPLKLRPGQELIIPAPSKTSGSKATPAAAPASYPAPAPASPVAPAPEASPVSPAAEPSPVAPAPDSTVTPPPANEPPPPVNRVDESSPVNAPKTRI